MNPTVICALYKFTVLYNLERLRRRVLAVMRENAVRGTLVLAEEGVNGTIAGRRAGVDAVLAWLRRQPGLEGIEAGESFADAPPFKRARVKIRREIVTLGVDGIKAGRAGVRVEPRDWNRLIDDDDVLLVDTRNDYEVAIGAFEGALNPHTTNFREFPAFAARHLSPNNRQKIAMYCTGGIRCEKSAAYLRQRGFEQVFHLKGGILNYLACVPEAESRWRGECFVFDDRVSVDHRLRRGAYDQCHACRRPLSAADKRSEQYAPGVSCPACYGRRTADDRRRFHQRQKQVALAAARGAVHLGPEAMAGACSNLNPTPPRACPAGG